MGELVAMLACEQQSTGENEAGISDGRERDDGGM